MLERVAGHDVARRIDRGVGVFQHLGEQVPARGGKPVPGAAVLRREQPEDQRQHEAGEELHPAVEPQVVGPQPPEQTDDAEQDQRPEQRLAHLGVDPLLDDIRQDRHERDRHRQAIPEQPGVVRIPVVVGRAEAGQEHAEEKHARGQVAAEILQAHRADQDERQIGDHVPEIRDAEQRLLVGELVVICGCGIGGTNSRPSSEIAARPNRNTSGWERIAPLSPISLP